MYPIAIDVYTMPESYRLGWNCGFYGSNCCGEWGDSGRLDAILKHGATTGDDHLFLAGYRHGRAGRDTCRCA
jgi:hypothetical protein